MTTTADSREHDSPTWFKLSGVDADVGDALVEDYLSNLLSIQITLLESNYNGERGVVLFCCLSDGPEDSDQRRRDHHVIKTTTEHIQWMSTEGKSPKSKLPTIFGKASAAAIAIVEEDDEEECVEYITEEEAYQLWLKQQGCEHDEECFIDDDEGDSRLVSSPDGLLVRPKHDARTRKTPLDEFNDGGMEGQEECYAEASILRDVDAAGPAMDRATARQLQRDPGLLDFDNVVRVHYAEVLEHLSKQTHVSDVSGDNSGAEDSPLSWKEHFGRQPLVVCGLGQSNWESATLPLLDELKEFQSAFQEAVTRRGSGTVVRTGNRETLVQNGFHHSKPELLAEVAGAMLERDRGNDDGSDASKNFLGTVVFNPIHEMPAMYRSDVLLGRWINVPPVDSSMKKDSRRDFPNILWNTILNPRKSHSNDAEEESQPALKFTLCMANEGFGIGMHRHGPALFFLTEGRKKWYLSHPAAIDAEIASRRATHPGFYRELSTHKCLQRPGELLLVPNLWYHEIYNLGSPTIGIQALAGERPEPGAL